ncbi:MAG: hypothetical protein Kow0042_31450 [Calditrichia bacterium]
MGDFSEEKLKEIMNHRNQPCVSIYLPTYRTGKEVWANAILFKNLLQQAEKELENNNLNSHEIDKILKPGKELLADEFFWLNQEDSLAVFLWGEGSHTFRLPQKLEELVVVANGCYCKPLLPLLNHNQEYYILALDLSHIQFYRANQYEISEIKLNRFPGSFQDFLDVFDFERKYQFQTQATHSKGSKAAMFHGHSVGKDELVQKRYILQYFHDVDKSVSAYLAGKVAPLILVGVDYLIPLYRESNTYPHLVESAIDKDPEALSEKELHQQSRQIIESLLNQKEQEALEKYSDLKGKGRTSGNLEEIVLAAWQGRVDTLFVDRQKQQWGVFNPETLQLELRDKGDIHCRELTDFAAVQTYLKKGSVFVLDSGNMPEHTPLAAIYRY